MDGTKRGGELIDAGALLVRLTAEYPDELREAHRRGVESRPQTEEQVFEILGPHHRRGPDEHGPSGGHSDAGASAGLRVDGLNGLDALLHHRVDGDARGFAESDQRWA